jgi:hypothetical protein
MTPDKFPPRLRQYQREDYEVLPGEPGWPTDQKRTVETWTNYISLSEHEALVKAARAGAFREAATAIGNLTLGNASALRIEGIRAAQRICKEKTAELAADCAVEENV